MANLYITEYANIVSGTPVATEPAVTEQKIAFTTAAPSAAFNDSTKYIRLLSDLDCHVLFGASPTATATSQKLTAGLAEWRRVTPQDKLSVYDGTS